VRRKANLLETGQLESQNCGFASVWFYEETAVLVLILVDINTDLHQNFTQLKSTPTEHTIFQVKKASLANVFHPRTTLAHLSLLEAHSCTGTPPEDSERTCTSLAFLAISVFGLQTQTASGAHNSTIIHGNSKRSGLSVNQTDRQNKGTSSTDNTL